MFAVVYRMENFKKVLLLKIAETFIKMIMKAE